MRLTPMLLAVATVMVATAAFAQPPKIAMEEMMVPSADPGIEIFVRNKRPAGMTNFPADKILLYVHGATYPSETAFDLPIAGASMMDLNVPILRHEALRNVHVRHDLHA